MTFLLALWSLIEPFKEWIAGGIGIIGTVLVARNSGKNAERAKQQKRELDAYEKHNEDLARAATAGRDKRVPIDHDPHNRDNWKP